MSIGPVLVSFVAIVAGTALALVSGRTGAWLQPIRTFGLVSVLGLILVLLLPEALSGLGLVALVVIGAGFALPTLLDRLGHGSSGDDPRLGTELGYWVVLAHQFCDGIALASESAMIHTDEHWDALVAMSVHTIPLTTLVVVTYNHWQGRAAAMLRACGIAAATIAGIAVIGAVPVAHVDAVHPWLAAAVSGMLLHIIVAGPIPRVANRRDRVFDTLASVAGVGLVALGLGGVHSHSDAGAMFSTRLADAFLTMSLTTAPALLFGLVAGALIGAFGTAIPGRWLNAKKATLDASRGALIGAPLPVCSCGVLAVSQGLRRRGASSAFLLAFLVATPEIGVDAFALSTQFLGWELSVVRLVAALLLAFAAGIVGERIAAKVSAGAAGHATECQSDHDHHHHHHDHHHHGHSHGVAPTPLGRFVQELDELVFHIGPWTLLGLVVAAYAEAALPASGWTAHGSGLDIVLLTAIAIPSYVCASSMTPLAAVLLAKGFSPGAVMAALLLGPATNIATFAFVRGELGKRGVWLWTAALIGVAWTLAVAINALHSAGLISTISATASPHAHASHWASWVAATALVALMSRGIWQVGFGRWISSLGDFMGFLTARNA